MRRAALRFAWLYAFIWAHFGILAVVGRMPIPGVASVIDSYRRAWSAVVDVVRRGVMGLDAPLYTGPPLRETPEGVVTYVLIAAVGAVAWLLMSDRERADRALARSAVFVSRYSLGLTLFSYGIAKVIPQQLSIPRMERLVTAFGDHGRVDVLWGFMGVAPAYVISTGAVEVTAALLLFFRPTRTLGAMIAAAAMLNVTVLNFTYGIGVKMQSAHLVGLALVVIAADWRRLVDVLFWRRPTAAPDLSSPFMEGWVRVPSRVFKLLFLGGFMAASTSMTWFLYTYPGEMLAANPLTGVHQVESFSLDGSGGVPEVVASNRWETIVVDLPWTSSLRMLDGSVTDVTFVTDPGAGTVSVTPPASPDPAAIMGRRDPSVQTGEPLAVFRLAASEDGMTLLRGEWDGRQAEIRLRDVGPFPVLSDGARPDILPGGVLPIVLLVVGVTLALRRAYELVRPGVPVATSVAELGCALYLGSALILSGFTKVIPSRFPFPDLFTLSTPFGQLTRAEVMAAGMGASPAYVVFTGLAEVAVGALLFFERTRLIGALAALGVAGHALDLTYNFDQPGLAAAALPVILSFVLVTPSARRLCEAFVWARAVDAPDRPVVGLPTARAGPALGVVCVVGAAMSFVDLQAQRAAGSGPSGDDADVQLVRSEPEDFLLVRQRFQWIERDNSRFW